MATSTCCGAETTMPELDICPDCLEHCDWEYQEDEGPEHDSAGFTSDDRIVQGQYMVVDADHNTK